MPTGPQLTLRVRAAPPAGWTVAPGGELVSNPCPVRRACRLHRRTSAAGPGRFATEVMTLDELDAALLDCAAPSIERRVAAERGPEWLNTPSKVGQVAAVADPARGCGPRSPARSRLPGSAPPRRARPDRQGVSLVMISTRRSRRAGRWRVEAAEGERSVQCRARRRS